jgi:nucleoside-diphosphate-sugar epimerase
MGFRRFMEAAYSGAPITVYGDGQQTRDFTHVADVVRANQLAMAAPAGEVVNVGGGRRVTLSEVLDLIGRATGRRLRVVHQPAQAGDARHTGADGTRAEALLGYRPEVDLADGIVSQAAWIARRQRSAAKTGV